MSDLTNRVLKVNETHGICGRSSNFTLAPTAEETEFSRYLSSLMCKIIFLTVVYLFHG